MKIEKIDHIHVYVRDLSAAMKSFSDLLSTKFSGVHVSKKLQLRSAMDPTGLELIESTSSDGMVAKAIQRRGACWSFTEGRKY